MVPVTAFYAALAALFLVYLGSRVTFCRRRHKVGLGDGGNHELSVLIRAHANAVENIPITLLLMLFAELNGLATVHLHTIGILLIATRLLHALGFIRSGGAYDIARFYGTLGGWLLIVALAIINVVLNYL